MTNHDSNYDSRKPRMDPSHVLDLVGSYRMENRSTAPSVTRIVSRLYRLVASGCRRYAGAVRAEPQPGHTAGQAPPASTRGASQRLQGSRSARGGCRRSGSGSSCRGRGVLCWQGVLLLEPERGVECTRCWWELPRSSGATAKAGWTHQRLRAQRGGEGEGEGCGDGRPNLLGRRARTLWILPSGACRGPHQCST